jgi:hypothetical protein
VQSCLTSEKGNHYQSSTSLFVHLVGCHFVHRVASDVCSTWMHQVPALQAESFVRKQNHWDRLRAAVHNRTGNVPIAMPDALRSTWLLCNCILICMRSWHRWYLGATWLSLRNGWLEFHICHWVAVSTMCLVLGIVLVCKQITDTTHAGLVFLHDVAAISCAHTSMQLY